MRRQAAAPRAHLDMGFLTFAAMVALVGIMFLFRLSGHNIYFLIFFIWSGVNACLALVQAKYFPRSFTQRARIMCFALAVVATSSFFSLFQLPITVVSVGIRSIPSSVELALIPFGDRDATRARSAFASRGDSDIVVDFVLPAAIHRIKTPMVLRFGSDSRVYDIFRLSYGTDFLLWRIPVAVFEGDALLSVVSVDRQNAVARVANGLRVSSRVRSRPSIQISLEEALISQNQKPWIRALAVAIWAFSFLLISAASIWRGWASNVRASYKILIEKARNAQLHAP